MQTGLVSCAGNCEDQRKKWERAFVTRAKELGATAVRFVYAPQQGASGLMAGECRGQGATANVQAEG